MSFKIYHLPHPQWSATRRPRCTMPTRGITSRACRYETKIQVGYMQRPLRRYDPYFRFVSTRRSRGREEGGREQEVGAGKAHAQV